MTIATSPQGAGPALNMKALKGLGPFWPFNHRAVTKNFCGHPPISICDARIDHKTNGKRDTKTPCSSPLVAIIEAAPWHLRNPLLVVCLPFKTKRRPFRAPAPSSNIQDIVVVFCGHHEAPPSDILLCGPNGGQTSAGPPTAGQQCLQDGYIHSLY